VTMRRLHKIATMKSPYIVLALAIALAGCASGNADRSRNTANGAPRVVDSATRAAATNSTKDELVDYAGHPCGSQNLYVKTHPCVFPRRAK